MNSEGRGSQSHVPVRLKIMPICLPCGGRRDVHIIERCAKHWLLVSFGFTIPFKRAPERSGRAPAGARSVRAASGRRRLEKVCAYVAVRPDVEFTTSAVRHRY